MKEIRDIVEAYNKIDTTTVKVALATVIHVAGSSYRRSGARMLVQDNGIWTGGISGGCLEGDALRKAHYSMARNRVDVVRYDTTKEDEQQIGVGLGCNGIIDVLLTPIDPQDEHNPINILASCLPERHTNCLLTVISTTDERYKPGSMLKYSELPAGYFDEEVTADIEQALQSGKSVVRQYAGLHLFIEVLPPAIRVVLFGHGYDVYPLLRIGNELGWEMNVVARASQTTPAMKELCKHIYDPDMQVPVDERTAFVLMAHDYKTDKDNLLMALQSEVPYVGMLGPLKRRNEALAELREEGHTFSEAQMARLYNPVGLHIGATGPEEIALAILAEIRAHFSGKEGGFLRSKQGPIHERN